MKHVITYDKEGWMDSYDGQHVMRIKDIPAPSWVGKTRGEHNVYQVINLKGCNGSGKSTIPMRMLHSEPTSVYLTANPGDKKPCGVFVPSLRTVIIGLYSEAINCGGCDALGDTQVVKSILAKLWKREVHIIFEGVIVGDIRSTFYEIMKAFNEKHQRVASFCFMGTKLSECFRRIQARNGGKPINEELVRQKYRNSCVQLKYYLEQGDIGVQVLSTDGDKDTVYNRFMGMYPELRAKYDGI